METTTETVEILNDLVQINNDRIEGYKRAARELDSNDSALKTSFLNMIAESKVIKSTLAEEVLASGGEVENGTTGRGKIYRAWMDVKAIFTGHNRQTVLSNCEAGEDAAQQAYTQALNSDDLPRYLREMLVGQQASLRKSHDKIKSLRDAHL
jgi:uncharacterized protein (TIGR02284 family)